MITIKLRREEIFNLHTALIVASNLTVPAKFRYALKRNTDLLEPIMAASRTAHPRPEPPQEIATGTPELEAHRQKLADWGKAWDVHMQEAEEVQLYQTDLVDIDDVNNFPDLPLPKPGDPVANAKIFEEVAAELKRSTGQEIPRPDGSLLESWLLQKYRERLMARNRQNQALISALSPIFRDGG